MMNDRCVNLDTVVQPAPHQVSCDLDGQAVILNLESGVYYGLDPIGAAVWKLIESPTTVGSVRDAIVARYQVEPERCMADLVELFDNLVREGLVEVRDHNS